MPSSESALISVMVPCFNAHETLPKAIASLLGQTYGNWECLLIDDGSTDSTPEFVSSLLDPRIKPTRLERNVGRGRARQIGLDAAQGEYLCFLDADDWIYPTKLARQAEILATEPEVAVAATGMAIISPTDELLGVRRLPSGGSPAPYVITRYDSVARPPIAFPTTMVRTASAKKLSYDAKLLLAQDLEFTLRLLRSGSLCLISELLYAYRESTDQAFSKLIQTRRYDRKLFWSYRKKSPASAAKQVAIASVKEVTYRLGGSLGLRDYFVARRSVSAG